MCLIAVLFCGIKHNAPKVAAAGKARERSYFFGDGEAQKNVVSPAGFILASAPAEQLSLHGFVFHKEPQAGTIMFCWVLGGWSGETRER